MVFTSIREGPTVADAWTMVSDEGAARVLLLTVVLQAAFHVPVVDGSAGSIRRAEIHFQCDE